MTAPVAAASRVLVVASELPPGPGGIGTHAHSLAVALAAQGRAVALLGSQDYVAESDRAAFARTSPVPVQRWPGAADPVRTAVRRRRALRRAISSFRPDVVVASGGRVLWLASVVCPAAGVPWVAVVHGTELTGGAGSRYLTRRALRSASRIVAVSRFTAGLVADLGCARPVDVIPNGADADLHRQDPTAGAAFRQRHGLGDRPMLLTVGNVTERKGQHLVVDALPRIVAAVPEVMYVVVGRPTTGDALRARARALGVADHVVVTGQVDATEVSAAYAAADVFAMTSTTTASGDVEGFGIAVLEAALSGVPAVVTVGTGAEETVVDDVTGLAVPGNPQEIAGALVNLLEDQPRRQRLGVEAERRARTEATWGHRAHRYGKVLDDVVAGRRPRMVVVSHTEHWRHADGTVMGLGSTTRELDHLASLTSELVHVAPLHLGPPPSTALAPTAGNVRLVPVPPAGGDTVRAKLAAVTSIPRWAATIGRELAGADVVHVRSPAGISMVALAVLAVRRQPRHRWVKYAGNWQPTGPEPRTYALQRWWLNRGLARASVTVNGSWSDQPPWVHTFDNPTLTGEEVDRGRLVAQKKPPTPPLRVVFAGRLHQAKGVDRAVEAVLALRARGVQATLDVVGDGPLRSWVEDRCAADAPEAIRLHGSLSRRHLEALLSASHVFLLPSTAEGFPKVVAEAMAFGCVPVTSGVGSLTQTLGETGGAIVVPDDGSWTDALHGLVDDRRRSDLVRVGLTAVERFTYDAYLDRVRRMALSDWDRPI